MFPILRGTLADNEIPHVLCKTVFVAIWHICRKSNSNRIIIIIIIMFY